MNLMVMKKCYFFKPSTFLDTFYYKYIIKEGILEICYCGREFTTKIGLGLHKRKCDIAKQKQERYDYNNTIKIKQYKHECFCGKKFKMKTQLSAHKAKCGIYQENILKCVDKNKLSIYFSNGMSANSIANDIYAHLNINARKIIEIAGIYGIPTFTSKESANNKKTRLKYKNTCMNIYGVDNVSKINKIKDKKRQKSINKYGVDNVFKSNEIKEKIKLTNLKRYGVENFIQSKEYNKYRNCGRKSYQHKIIENILTEMDVEFISEINQNFTKFNMFLNRNYNPRPDILIENKKIIIEIFGDRWHGNPKKYKSSDILSLWQGDVTVGYKWKFDEERNKQLESFGYKVIVLWGSDINNNIDKIKDFLCKLLK